MQLAIRTNSRYESKTFVQCPIKIPFSPHLAAFRPGDASQKFGYSDVAVQLWIGDARWTTNRGGTVTLYGSDQHPDTMLTRHPGEWVGIIGKGRITLPRELMGFIRNEDAVRHANARVSIHEDETLLTADASATISHAVCLRPKVRGRV